MKFALGKELKIAKAPRVREAAVREGTDDGCIAAAGQGERVLTRRTKVLISVYLLSSTSCKLENTI